MASDFESTSLESLNSEQRNAVLHEGAAPLLIIAGAGSGKTHTLASRVARLIDRGADPRRILLVTFSRRAAQEMARRVERIVGHGGRGREQRRDRPGTARTQTTQPTDLSWAGTFHSVANRLLRLHAHELGLDPAFTVLDRSDAADLLDVLRHRLGLSQTERRFPRKDTCLAIYSRTVNAQCPIEKCLTEAFPWCTEHAVPLRRLFAAYVEAKQKDHVLDYDDLLLYWHALMGEPALASRVRRRFDHVLVDEYQDTNALQAAILRNLCPEGTGLTVVGDDAQAIYSFRAATVRNILDFPTQFKIPAEVLTLAQNYRSTQPILEAANAVIAGARERYAKDLHSTRRSSQKPYLVTAFDEDAQVDYVVGRVLEQREAGLALRRQAVLFRTAHHSDLLEVELARRNIPFVKFGGLKFLEAAHVKDALCVLRWGENLRDTVAAYRVLQLLPGIGPALAERVVAHLEKNNFAPAALTGFPPPAAAAADWPALCALVGELREMEGSGAWAGQLGLVRRWYQPHLDRIYDHAALRAQDLDQLELIAAHYPSRERFLSELTLDPPQATGDHAGPPHLDEDYLILSTIHSAKGQEWDAVFILNAADGCIPSDMSTASPEQIDEERRLLYVAMTRARDSLHVIHPLRFHVHHQRRSGDRHVYAPRTRFIPDAILDRFERVSHGPPIPVVSGEGASDQGLGAAAGVDVAARLRAMWN
jgi:DNA helicase-2/ATP-dependent DNA helicase PcrA